MNKKFHKRELKPKLKDEIGDTMHRSKVKAEKVKYKHKNFWLDEEEGDYEMPKYKDEEE